MRKNLFVRMVHRITTGKSIYRILLTPVAPLFFFGFVAGLVFASIMTDAWFGSGKIIQPPWNIWLSRPFMLSGLFLMGWSASRFFKAKGTPVPFNPPKRLVTTGPYAWSSVVVLFIQPSFVLFKIRYLFGFCLIISPQYFIRAKYDKQEGVKLNQGV